MTTGAITDIEHILLPDAQHRAWARIARDLAAAIVEGVFSPGQRLPSEHCLAQRYSVNRHTVRRALFCLRQAGLLRATQGSGTYVEPFAIDLMVGRRTRHRQNLTHAGLRGCIRVLDSETLSADPNVASALRVPVGSPVLCLRTVGDADGRPIHTGVRYYPLPRFEGLDAEVRATGSITQALAKQGVTDYTRWQTRITARMPDSVTAADLQQPPNRPALWVTSVNIDAHGVPIEFARTWFAGDRVTLVVEAGDGA